MGFRNKLHRYFVANHAPVFSVRQSPAFHCTRIPCRTANSSGFYWLWFKIEWRKPYHNLWAYNPIAKRWEVPPSLPAEGEILQ